MNAINVGDKVRLREDATTEGKPFGQIFRELTWRVVTVNGDLIEVATNYLGKSLTMHTFTHKLRHATPEELGN